MDLLQMLFQRVDPFAVYQAERALREMLVDVPRKRLVNHYLVMGQLRTIVELFRESGKKADLDAIFARDLMNGPYESGNPRFVAPFLLGSIYAGNILLILCLLFLFSLRHSSIALGPTSIH